MIGCMEKMKWITLAMTAVLLTGCAGTTEIPDAQPETAAAEPAGQPSSITVTNPIEVNVIEEDADLSGYKWLYDDKPAFSLISLEESIRFFKEGGTGIIVYSADTCPFCNRAVPVLNSVLKEYGIKAYYIDTNTPISSDSAKSFELYNELCSYIDSIFERDENGEPMFQIPEVIAVKEGKITGHHLSLVESFILTDEEAQLTDGEKDELSSIYRGLIESIAD